MKTVCVFCGSSSGTEPAYGQAAEEVGRLLASQGLDLVYGGGDAGLMGRVSRAAMAAGGRVYGVIPQKLQGLVDHRSLTGLEVVPGMHERKALMYRQADGFLILPGGIGTLDELFEVWTWQQIGYHDKPVGLLNVAGFFDTLLLFLDSVTRQGFMKPVHRQSLVVDGTPAGLLAAMAAWIPPAETKKPERGT